MLITIEPKAKDKIKTMLDAENKSDSGLRIRITGRTAQGYQHALSLVDAGMEKPDDKVVESDGIKVVLDPKTANQVDGARIDFVDDMYGGGFKVDNPNQPTWSSPLEQQLQDLIDSQVNPSLAMHGGYLELLEVKEDTLYVHFGGGCHGCGMVNVTLKQGVQQTITTQFPQITQVIDTTDHASGENPYYRGEAAHSH